LQIAQTDVATLQWQERFDAIELCSSDFHAA
jgi:hypothetical protein